MVEGKYDTEEHSALVLKVYACYLPNAPIYPAAIVSAIDVRSSVSD